MANLKEIRNRIKSVKTTQQMTRAMKMVAAAKLRRAQDNILRLRPYALKLQEIMGNISANMTEDLDSPYAEVREANKVLIIAVTSNRGLCGAFNANIIKQVSSLINEDYAEQNAAGNLDLICIGKKVAEFFAKRKFNVIGGNRDIYADLTFEAVANIAQEAMDGFEAKKWDKVVLVFNEFKNVVVQNKVVETFLPLAGDEPAQEEESQASDYIFEPAKDEILDVLIPKSLKTQLFKAVLESNAGEQGARMTAMDNATENAAELLKELKLKYNQARQAAITTEILEIVAGAEALGSS